MTRWTRTPTDRMCGRCAGLIRSGSAVLVIELPQLSHTKIRCETCGGGAPPDLPLVIEQKATTPTSTWSRVGLLPFDVKMAQAGREPGEEG